LPRLVIASNNPVKVRATLAGFQLAFPGEQFQTSSVSVPSGVPDQPVGNHQTLQGALNRAQTARTARPEAEYWIGIEGGVEWDGPDLYAFAWVVVCSLTLTGRGRTGTFLLPPQVAELVGQGMELGHADDVVFERSNSKQEDGAIGILTRNLLDRAGLYEHAVLLALVPFLNPELYS
jgi:inosine/xanthosine triphosphatase